MAKATKVGIIGGGWPGLAHARGYRDAGGFAVTAVVDPIPDREQALLKEAPHAKPFADARELLTVGDVDAVSICVPTHLRADIVKLALKTGRHVMVETPPAATVRDAKSYASSAEKYKRILAYALQRRFGGAEMAATQAIEKGYAGTPYHVRASWMRTRGIPVGTGWYTDREKAGGGALIDVGLPVLDLAWTLLGRPSAESVFAVAHARLDATPEANAEEFAVALIKFEGGATLELSSSWAINQPPSQNGVTCRVNGTDGAVDVYTPAGPVLHHKFDGAGKSKATPLKLPRVSGHAALMRQFRDAIVNGTPPSADATQGVQLMQMIEALYKSAATGKSVAMGSKPISTDDAVVE